MDLTIIKELGIESEDYQEILDGLSALQDDCLERIEYVDDEEREEIEQTLDKIKTQLDAVKKIIKEKENESSEPSAKPKSNLIAVDDAIDTSAKKNIPIAVSEDELENSTSVKSEKEIKRDEKKKEEQLKAQADKIRKEAEANKKADDKVLKDKIKQDQTNANTSADSGAASNASSNDSSAPSAGISAITQGLNEYNNKNYSVAYQILNNAVNDSKNKTDPNYAFAEYVLAHMFKNSLGTTKDIQRAQFWFENSAKHKDPHGALEMGLDWSNRTPNSLAEDEEITRNALSYFKMAVDNSASDSGLLNLNKDAMNKYVYVCEKKPVTAIQLRLAYDYLNKLKELENDAYLKDQIEKRKSELKRAKKGSARKASGVYFSGVNDIVLIASILLIAFGFAMLSGGFLKEETFHGHVSFWSFTKLDSLHLPSFVYIVPKLISDLLNKITNISLQYEVIGDKGLYGLALVFFGFLIKSFTDADRQGKITFVVSTILSFVPAIIIMMAVFTKLNIYDTVYKHTVYTGKDIIVLGICTIVCILLSKIPHWIKETFL